MATCSGSARSRQNRSELPLAILERGNERPQAVANPRAGVRIVGAVEHRHRRANRSRTRADTRRRPVAAACPARFPRARGRRAAAPARRRGRDHTGAGNPHSGSSTSPVILPSQPDRMCRSRSAPPDPPRADAPPRSTARRGDEELLYRHESGGALVLTDWSPDGRFLCF